MQTCDYETSSLSLVSWARTTRPVRLGSLFTVDAATDNIMFGCSAIALVLAPVAALIVLLFG